MTCLMTTTYPNRAPFNRSFGFTAVLRRVTPRQTCQRLREFS